VASTSDWSRDEVQLIVEDYFDMLRSELSGTAYNKAEHRRRLMPKLDGRSNGSVEFKHCNISAVLSEANQPFIDGYKPRPNTQSLLRKVVLANWKQLENELRPLRPPVATDESDDPFEEPKPPADDPAERYYAAIRLRRGASAFRKGLMSLYSGRCAITGDGPEDVLEAAHIQPHSVGGRNSLDNGLLLRADIHTLFDLGLLKIEPLGQRVELDTKLRGTTYESLQGRRIRERLDGSSPARGFLKEKYDRKIAAQNR
jgi:5-methylcytosine-specific restriction protein A